MQRLFSTFPDGWPGTGLLLLRIALAAVLIRQALFGVPGMQGAAPIACAWVAGGGALFVLAGLATPIMGVLVGVIELVIAMLRVGDPWTAILVGALAIGLAMLGPGAWSIDARLCGRRRIEIPPR